MNHITLEKASNFNPRKPKHYTVTADGKEVGAIFQDVSMTRWIVEDDWANEVSRHSTIKAAVRVAGKALA